MEREQVTEVDKQNRKASISANVYRDSHVWTCPNCHEAMMYSYHLLATDGKHPCFNCGNTMEYQPQ